MTQNVLQPSETYTPGYTENAVQFMAGRTAAEHAAFFLPYLRPGLSLLDCGCGPGVITLGLAEAVAPGLAVGFDLEIGQTEPVQQVGQARGLTNLQFRQGVVYELPFEAASFDRVFAHALLEHLAEPARAIAEMRRVLKPGGLIGLCSPDWGGFIVAPASPEVEAAIAFYQQLQSQNGGDVQAGRKLGSLLAEVGFSQIKLSARYECYTNRDRIAEYLAQRIERAAGAGQEAKQLAQALRAWAGQPFGLFAQSWVSAVGQSEN